MKKHLAIIPARGGSKRIPNKNIRSFFGAPIIQYSINAALQSNCFDEVMVSTENKKISEIAISCGAKVPFFRSDEMASNEAMFIEVMEEVLNEYEKRGQSFDTFSCLLATAPFLSPGLFQKAFNLLESTGADSVLPVVRSSYPVQQAFRIKEGKLDLFWPKYYEARTQDLEPSYFDCGLFFLVKIEAFRDKRKLVTENSVPLIVSELEAHDIDTEEDWAIAERKYYILNNFPKKTGESGLGFLSRDK
ncbi:pseudaminic acid cytidylyltransferase [Candidatus Babeliales bacterium]|nr:pseudaminic acid cytidylyltransferase [Candidatus Babeliales bacterium]